MNPNDIAKARHDQALSRYTWAVVMGDELAQLRHATEWNEWCAGRTADLSIRARVDGFLIALNRETAFLSIASRRHPHKTNGGPSWA